MSQVFCQAESGDSGRILEILESSAANGSIELLYTRRPDACLSYKKESEEAEVYVVKDDEKILGTVAQIPREVYIGGEIKKAAYICGLKKDINYSGFVNWGRAFFRSMVKEDIDSYFCSVVSDNSDIINMFDKRKRSIAVTERVQRYTTYMIAPRFRFKLKERGHTFRRAEREDADRIIEFLNSEGRKKDLFPLIRNLEQFTDLRLEDFFILEGGDGILAAGALWDQSGYRQYIVKKYNGIMRFARLLNPLLGLLGYIRLPRENENISFPMLSFFLSRDDNEEYCKAFLNNIAAEIKKNYGMFVVGAAESYFAGKIYKKLKSIHFDTEIYSVNFIKDGGKTQELRADRLWLECGLL